MKKRNALNAQLSDFVPIIAFAVVFVFFGIISHGTTMSAYNLKLVLNQSLITILVGTGVLFVVAQGGIDLSVGVNLAFAGVIGAHVGQVTGSSVLFVVVTIVVAMAVGLLNGIVVSKFKVASFMMTIAMLIGLRGIINYIQTIVGTETVPTAMRVLSGNSLRLPLFVVIVVIMAYIFEFTKLGRESRAIGENETATKFVGINIGKMKIIAFVLSGLMVGIGSIFSMTSLGGTSQTMGIFFEMQVAMAIFFGGVLVTGGTSAKIYKVLLGSFTITVITNGLAIIGKGDSETSESVEGILLLVILFVTILVNTRRQNATKSAL